MYSCTRKLQQIKYSLSGWCREYRIAHNIIWDNGGQKCLQAQENLGNDLDLKETKRIKYECFQEAMIR